MLVGIWAPSWNRYELSAKRARPVVGQTQTRTPAAEGSEGMAASVKEHQAEGMLEPETKCNVYK